ncbi:LysR family transcriptional regulator [Streptomyces flaveolus]|uniref:LysR family transcriptional regulator n=1 Tax=Streptomyces flaveolus TaxID=67297 RepID=UPI00341FD550
MNLSKIDINLLVAPDALLTGRSVTRAARRVGISRPGMSSALARLRKLPRGPLLVRQGNTLVPDPTPTREISSWLLVRRASWPATSRQSRGPGDGSRTASGT